MNGKRKNAGFILALLVVVGAGAFLFFHFHKNKNDGYQYVIGVSQANLNEPWRIAMDNEIKEESENYRNLKVVFRDAGGSPEKQINDIEEFSRGGIDLLIVSMDDSQKLTAVVSEVYQSTPVIVLDRAVEGYNYTLYIGNDNLSIGKQAAKFVHQLFPQKDCNIVEIQGTLDSETTLERTQGFHEELKKYQNLHLVRTLICNWKLDDAASDAEQVLKEQSEPVDVFFAESDYMAQGVYQAAHTMGLNPVIIGVDGLSGKNGGLELVKSGKLMGTFLCSTGGKEAVDYAVKILNGEQNIPKKIILRSQKITAENVGDFFTLLEEKRREQEKITLGYVQLPPESKWREACGKSIRESAEAAGINLIFLQAGTTQKDEIAMIRELIRRKVDVISFSPIVSGGWDEVLREAKRAGIPVIVSDRIVDSEESLWNCCIGSDFEEEARRIGRQILEYQKNNAAGEKLNVLQLMGTIGSSAAEGRNEGLREILSPHPEISVTNSHYCDFTYESGKEEMARCLRIYGANRFQVVYSQNDDMAMGAIQAVKQYGLVPGKDIVVFGTDGTRQALLAVKRGEIYDTVECNPILGPQVMMAVQKVVEGEAVPLRIINSENIFSRDISLLDIFRRKY